MKDGDVIERVNNGWFKSPVGFRSLVYKNKWGLWHKQLGGEFALIHPSQWKVVEES